jgi:hypothetical protein
LDQPELKFNIYSLLVTKNSKILVVQATTKHKIGSKPSHFNPKQEGIILIFLSVHRIIHLMKTISNFAKIVNAFERKSHHGCTVEKIVWQLQNRKLQCTVDSLNAGWETTG